MIISHVQIIMIQQSAIRIQHKGGKKQTPIIF